MGQQRWARRWRTKGLCFVAFILGLSACASLSDPSEPAHGSDPEGVAVSPVEDGDWPIHGRDFYEQRYSPLEQIGEGNVADLGLAWSFDLGTMRGVQSTPIVVGGVFYVTGPWSLVYALDARTGKELWRFDPEVPKQHARYACCTVSNRGVAVDGGRAFVGTLDGRLIGLDVADGSVIWETLTVDPEQPYTITGAPRVVEGLVVIGNGGAEYGVRGYVSAYHVDSGELAWRTFTVPGDPSKPFESPAMEYAASTWNGQWWKYGGGGTVWDAMAYDPELDLLYVGSGNGSPHARWARSPGGGDNLYLSSILALRPATGELVWYFQTTPADTWDYTATQHILLADLEVDGRVRKVVMQAPKNGFFFVLDRETGEFISGAPYVKVTWAEGLDAEGRPIESPHGDYRHQSRMIHPSQMGGHNWHPMSFHPGTGLVYVPALDISTPMGFDPDWTFQPGRFNLAIDFEEFAEGGGEAEGFLLAWDPIQQREVWRIAHRAPWSGGTLATGGNLVFQGSSDGRLVAYRASDGNKLWESPAGTGVMAGPVTYALDGVQYVSVAAGWGGSFPMGMGEVAARARVRGGGRVLTFRLGGTAEVPPGLPWPAPPPAPVFQLEASEADVAAGSSLYHAECGLCHGAAVIGGGSLPDLRYASTAVHERFQQIVHAGEREALGMPGFSDRLSLDQIRQIQAYVLSAANAAAAGQKSD
ncbi:PQQ-dependent dehydrogenase, methanol/ethanol family [Myxococcota bacterium]|nr:PQQ-dependent dehydrogenase, methanol/ethanol family [Myxococcota bacterium]